MEEFNEEVKNEEIKKRGRPRKYTDEVKKELNKEYQLKWRQQHKDKIRAYNIKYSSTDNGRENLRRAWRNYGMKKRQNKTVNIDF
jgi:hypothetical protein